MIAKVARDNPADLLLSTGLQPGELAMYVNYPGRDNYNFDAQDKSFAWLAAQRGHRHRRCSPRGGSMAN